MHSNQEIDTTSTIFVTLAACNEYLLEHTIKSAMAQANIQERVFFGVFNNILEKEKSLLDNEFFTNNANIFYAEIVTPAPMGTGFGRMNASLLKTQDHDYVLQIDSHTVFTKDWDLKLIENFNNVKEIAKTDKVILSAIPRGNLYYEISNRDSILSYDNFFKEKGINEIDMLNNNYHEFDNYKNTKPEIVFTGWQGKNFDEINVGLPITYGAYVFGEEKYPEINCIHASIVFFKYSVIREVMHDPSDHFNGDQINQSLRLLSRGYRIFSMQDPLFLSLSKYENPDNSNDKVVNLLDPEWNWRSFCSPNSVSAKYLEHSISTSAYNYEKIISGDYLGYWGAPDERSLSEAKKIMGFKEIDNNE
jgi:hypothetical protein